jgi:hypothetical protein
VLEPCDAVEEKILVYRAGLLRTAWPEACAARSAKLACDAAGIFKAVEGEA